MAHFVVTAKKKPRLDAASDVIAIGTRTSCDLTLRDPIAAEVHARIAWRGVAYEIEDAGTATGTFVNGVAVERPTALAEGDEIVIGVNKLVAHLEREGEGIALHLDLQEDAFFQKARMSGGDDPRWIPGDREAFKESEIDFSRFPALRVAGWSAVVIAVLLLLSLAIRPVRAGLVQPGPLHDLHAEHLAGESCEVCHEPFGGVAAVRCLDCHAEKLEGRHPFDPGDGSALAALGAPEASCARCHVEHMGTETRIEPVEALADLWDGARPLALVRDPAYFPADPRAALACEECHADEVPDEAAARRRLQLAATAPSAGERASTSAVEKFSHALHVGASEIDCTVCHVPRSATADATGAQTRDFAVVPFETCMGCHQPEDGEGFGAEPREDWLAAAPDVELEWHGMQAEGCERCHVETGRGELREVTSKRLVLGAAGGTPADPADADGSGARRGRLLFAYASRGHVEEARAAGRECTTCHGEDVEDFASGERTARRFWHGLHLPLAPAGPDAELSDAEARALAASCEGCHAGAAEASSLDFAPYDDEGCAACHASEANGGAVPEPSPRARTVEIKRGDFPHDAHAARSDGPLARGCLACHVLGGGADDFRLSLTTPPEVRDCTACHADHANVGGGSCQVCHEGDDPLFFSAEARPAPRGGSFGHFQADHAENVADCTSCHAGIESAEVVADVTMPDPSDPACFECHFERRYHWR